jgi:hypothetical protein
MSVPAEIPTRDGFIVYRSGLREKVQLLEVATGWRLASVPLGSETIAYGDYLRVKEQRDGMLQVIAVLHGGWRTVRSKTPIPPSEKLTHDIASRGWLAAWNIDGWLSICVPVEVFTDAQRAIERWEQQSLLLGRQRGLAS